MSHPLPYVFYFLGPFLLAVLWHWRCKADWSFFFIGMPLFLLSQVGTIIVQTVVVATAILALGKGVSSTGSIFGSGLAAGICEESCRVLGFHWMTKRGKPATWNRGIMYAIGHSGMETMLVGLGLLATIAAANYFPDKIPAEQLELLRQTTDVPAWRATVFAVHRLFCGLLIHAGFTSLVVLYMQRGDWRWLVAAMTLHAANNWVAMSLQSELANLGFLAGYTACLVLVYSALLFVTHRLTDVGSSVRAEPTGSPRV